MQISSSCSTLNNQLQTLTQEGRQAGSPASHTTDAVETKNQALLIVPSLSESEEDKDEQWRALFKPDMSQYRAVLFCLWGGQNGATVAMTCFKIYWFLSPSGASRFFSTLTGQFWSTWTQRAAFSSIPLRKKISLFYHLKTRNEQLKIMTGFKSAQVTHHL